MKNGDKISGWEISEGSFYLNAKIYKQIISSNINELKACRKRAGFL
jgi:hypothetical protein